MKHTPFLRYINYMVPNPGKEEYVMSWEILAGLITLFGFGVSVVTPLIKLNTNIVKLNDSLGTLQSAVKNMQENSEADHKRMWEHNNTQDIIIDNHEKRLTSIEYTMDVTEKLHPELTGIRQHVAEVDTHLNSTDSEQ